MSLRAEQLVLELGDGETRIRALDEVSVSVAAGELLMVLGPSGAGKSSLLAVCGGLRTPTSGRVWIAGKELTASDPRRLARLRLQHIGFVFQQSNLVPALTALDQLLLLVHMGGRRPAAADREKALALLDEVGMADKAGRRPGQLSGGERQRVGIARAFMNAPEVLLIDEPTSMLDRSRGQQIVALLRQACHEHQVATLMVTHDTDVIAAADRVVNISDGRLAPLDVADMTATQVTHAAH